MIGITVDDGNLSALLRIIYISNSTFFIGYLSWSVGVVDEGVVANILIIPVAAYHKKSFKLTSGNCIALGGSYSNNVALTSCFWEIIMYAPVVI